MELIYSYSREQAIEDGVLVDVSETAKEAGIQFPTALTRAVWNSYVEVPSGVTGQDESGRLWDILWMLRNEIMKWEGKNRLDYVVFVRNDDGPARKVKLKAICGPGDKLEPVITVMLPDED